MSRIYFSIYPAAPDICAIRQPAARESGSVKSLSGLWLMNSTKTKARVERAKSPDGLAIRYCMQPSLTVSVQF